MKKQLRKVLVVADDLTGATNAASYFAKNYNDILVFIDSNSLEKKELDFLKKKNVVILNTNTRTSEKKEAYRSIKLLCSFIAGFNDRILIKKIDTAFRGNVAIELDTILTLTSRKLCFVINSIPSMRRITLNGFQVIDGKKLESSDFLNDPYEKIKSSYIPDILGERFKSRIGVVLLEDVRKGTDFIAKKIERYVSKDRNVIIFDSVKDSDIDAIVKTANRVFSKDSIKNTLWVGSLGLIESIKKNLLSFSKDYEFEINGTYKKNKTAGILSENISIKKFLGISASKYSKTIGQIKKAGKLNFVSIIKIKISDFLNFKMDGINDKEMLSYLNQSDYLNNSEFRIALRKNLSNIISRLKNNSVFLIPEIDARLREKRIEKIILRVFANILGELFSPVPAILTAHKKTEPDKNNKQKKDIQKDIKKLILIGGETSFYVLKALDVQTLQIKGKIESGIDYGFIVDGLLKGKEILIKGGSVGDENAIIRMICQN